MTDFTTWEEAAAEAAQALVETYRNTREAFSENASPKLAPIDWVENDLDEMIKLIGEGGSIPRPMATQMFAVVFASVACTALHHLTDSAENPTEVVNVITELIALKQADYGHGNIMKFGVVGLAVRMSDKVARIQNLTRTGAEPQNEALADSWHDLVGYSLIGIMLMQGTFMLPLAADVIDAGVEEILTEADNG